MALRDITQMATSHSLLQRIAASAAMEGQADPVTFAQQNAWAFAASPGWAEAWGYASDTQTVNQNPDLGARNDVINDDMILSAVQAIRGAA